MRSQYKQNAESNDDVMGDVVTVDLTNHDPGTPLGMLLAPALAPTVSSAASAPSKSNVTILAGWEHLPNGNKLGPIQRSGLVRLGDRLVHINNVDVTHMAFRDVMDLLKNMLYGSGDGHQGSGSGGGGGGGIRLRSMGFAPIGGKDVMASSSSLRTFKDGTQRGIDMSTGKLPSPQNQRLYTFRSSIHRARVRVVKETEEEEEAVGGSADVNGSNEVHHSASFLMPGENEASNKNKKAEKEIDDNGEAFVEYEICCHLVIHFRGGAASYRIGGKGEQQTWTVWKRYSEFKLLDEKLRKSYGWHFDSSNNGRGLTFPPPHYLSTFFGGSLNPSFVESRRKELEQYWQSLHRIDAIFDFSNPSSHRFSRDLASFLSLENHLFRNKASAISSHSSWASGKPIAENGATAPVHNPSHVSLGTSEDQDDSSLSSSLPTSGFDNDGIAMLKDDASHSSLSLGENADVAHGSETRSSSAGYSKRRNKPRRKKRPASAAKPAFQRQFL